MTTSPVRRAAILLTALAAAGGGLLAAPAQAQAPAATTTAPMTSTRSAKPMTTVTFDLHGCKACRITLNQAVQGRQHIWQTKSKKAHDGTVTFTVPTKRTHGLDASIEAPWESSNGIPTGFVSQIAFRYGQEKPGSTVSFHEARAKRRASACWAGTSASDVTIPVRVRKVKVEGTTGRTNATLAWAKPTQEFLRPMKRTVKGIYGTQEVPICKAP